ncbi:stearoyl-CoA 9-desaturase domain protein [Leptospira weilii str. Ecochallenge]|uniref:Stearoyl-CoA 9-desaturase domain protein n=1 Tax=Leptospira weilii str. Ecochallenge TaxID=1049986 RepID=N1U3M1_9LEPT|nr:stearoyl-CoA 9-desaturase domain protein [Leptospira weilii str. Ecochallenge]
MENRAQLRGNLRQKSECRKEFRGNYPEWPAIDRLSDSWTFRLFCGTLYTLFYLYFVPEGQYGWYLLLPIHWVMGPLHGAIVNWCGHMYGYRNHKKNPDNSKNTLFVDFMIAGELYQNNHHAHPNSPNFAFRWFELDLTYQIMKVLHLLKIIKIQRAIWTEKGKKRFADPTFLSKQHPLLQPPRNASFPIPRSRSS